MHSKAAAIVTAARGCVGTRFRSQGRVAGIGLDCIGVALVAAQAAGIGFTVPSYALGGDHEAELEAALARRGCLVVAAAAPGDLVVAAPARGRRHIGVRTPGGVIHAHAGLGRVVEGPLDPGWTIIGAWRLPEEA